MKRFFALAVLFIATACSVLQAPEGNDGQLDAVRTIAALEAQLTAEANQSANEAAQRDAEETIEALSAQLTAEAADLDTQAEKDSSSDESETFVFIPFVPGLAKTNIDAVSPVELDEVPIETTNFPGADCEPAFRQEMQDFGPNKWIEEDHLFVNGQVNCMIDFLVTDHTGGSGYCRLLLYATMAPDFGIIRFGSSTSTEGSLSPEIDLYAPSVQPSGPIDLGLYNCELYSVSAHVIGRNPKSSNVHFGLDAFTLRFEQSELP